MRWLASPSIILFNPGSTTINLPATIIGKAQEPLERVKGASLVRLLRLR